MATIFYPLLRRTEGISSAGVGVTNFFCPLSFSRASRGEVVTSIGTTSIITSFTTQLRTNYGTAIANYSSFGSSFVEFVSKPLKSFTLSGNVRVRAYARENAAGNNNTYGFALHKLDTAGVLSSAIARTHGPYEAATTPGGQSGSWTTSVSVSTLFDDGDRLLLRFFSTNVNVSGAGAGVSIYLNGPTANASGDTFLELQEDITVFEKFKFILP